MDAQQGGMPAAGGAGPAPTKATAGQATGNQDALGKYSARLFLRSIAMGDDILYDYR